LKSNKKTFLSQKTLFLGQKVWIKFGKVWKSWEKLGKVGKQGFPNVRNLQKFQKLFYSELSENYEKMTLNSNFENREVSLRTACCCQKSLGAKAWSSG